MTVSAPTSTSGSMTAVSGRKMVTPASIRRAALAARACASMATSSAILGAAAFGVLMALLLLLGCSRMGCRAALRDGDVDRMDRTEVQRVERRLDLRSVADDQYGK